MNKNIELFKNKIKDLTSGKIEELEHGDCPQSGDPTDCSSCIYGCDYNFINDDCINRHTNSSKWVNIRVCNPENNTIQILGWVDHVLTIENSKVIAEVSIIEDYKQIKYIDKSAENDCYALSAIVDALRIIK